MEVLLLWHTLFLPIASLAAPAPISVLLTLSLLVSPLMLSTLMLASTAVTAQPFAPSELPRLSNKPMSRISAVHRGSPFRAARDFL